ncbi:MAG: peptidylprolyl isomerase [Betaproteobacteria bacterium]
MNLKLLRGLALFSLTVASSAVLAQNLAVVNNRPIPKAREDAWVAQLKQQGQQDTPQLREMIKQELIRREIFLQEAGRRGLPEKPEVKFQLDVQRQNTLIQALMRDELEKRPITDAEVAAAYETQRKQMGDREYRARHILLEKEDEAKQVIEQLKRGAKFEDLAKRSKDTGSAANGGDLDWAGADAYVKPFSDAMVKLQKGQVVDAPVQSQFGWHIIRLDDERPLAAPPYDEVKQQLQQRFQQQAIEKAIGEVRAKAKIE